MKVSIKGIEGKRNLVQIVFLELKKYKPEMKVNYNKVRWMELFGNKPFTHKPERIITKADRVVDVKEWNKEDKAMYDEYTRAWDGWLAHLAYVEEKKEEALEKGREEGIALGEVRAVVEMVKEGFITKEIGARKLNLSEKEFEKYL